MLIHSENSPFSAVGRVYGEVGAQRLRDARVCVVGIGGVGSWIVEALARTGIGSITLIDHDDIALTNINRQIHADATTLEHSKVEVMAERVRRIHPDCKCTAIDDMLVPNNIQKYINQQFDYVIDAIDVVTAKAALICHCKRNSLPVITVGGAGGRTDPTMVMISDLNKTWNDPLAANVRRKLRRDYGWTRNSARRFGVECVFSSQQSRYPQPNGETSYQKPGVASVTLDCDSGYGSLVSVTAVFGFVAASRVMDRLAGI
ncbi:hypothetical protein AB833_02960 [Chromatiales bacterium (ex Bugula neritina AB1)]|nr:hypothetical protein AB833_02960 [Chromatiales bacterium (ex Bugula neritina AB1)]